MLLPFSVACRPYPRNSVAVLFVTNAGAVDSDDEGITNTPFWPPELAGFALKGIQKAAPAEPELLPPEELEPPDEELLLDDELLELLELPDEELLAPELLELLEELLDEVEPLDPELELPPPQAASTKAMTQGKAVRVRNIRRLPGWLALTASQCRRSLPRPL
jgi:hypothetical protein